MADIIARSASLGDLKSRASELALAVESLEPMLEQGATRLKREDEVFRLKTLRSAIVKRLESTRGLERAASTGYKRASIEASFVRLGLGLVTRASENPRMQAVSRRLLAGPARKEPTFGAVLVRIGPGGVPQDVDVVSISELARGSRRDQREVISELIAQGILLLSEKEFSGLAENLADHILKGEVSLPVLAQRLYELAEQCRLRLSKLVKLSR